MSWLTRGLSVSSEAAPAYEANLNRDSASLRGSDIAVVRSTLS